MFLSLWVAPREESRAWWLLPGDLGWIFLGKQEPRQGKCTFLQGRARPGRACVPWCHLGCDTSVRVPWRCGGIEFVSLGVTGGVGELRFRSSELLGSSRAHLGHSGKLLGVQRENEKCHCVKLLSHIRLLKFHFTALKFLWWQRHHRRFARISVNEP